MLRSYVLRTYVFFFMSSSWVYSSETFSSNISPPYALTINDIGYIVILGDDSVLYYFNCETDTVSQSWSAQYYAYNTVKKKYEVYFYETVCC